MNLNSNGDAHITVIPFCPHNSENRRIELLVRRLYFWYNETFDHLVNDETVTQFLKQARMFGATIYPDCPELGCSAINCEENYKNGEAAVNEIHYKGQVIYCRS